MNNSMDSRIENAKSLASDWHAGEVRDFTQGEPYINHPIAVAGLVATVSDQWEVVAAAFLHDVLECDEALRAQREQVILEQMGPIVLELVLEVTNPSKRSDGDRATRKAIDRAHLSKASPNGQTIRLADAVHNFSNLNERNPAFALTYAKEKLQILPLTLEGAPELHSRLASMLEEILTN